MKRLLLIAACLLVSATALAKMMEHPPHATPPPYDPNTDPRCAALKCAAGCQGDAANLKCAPVNKAPTDVPPPRNTGKTQTP